MPSGAGNDASLRHYLAVLRRRWPVVVLLAVLGCGTAALLTSVKAPVYRATASILLQPSTSEELLANANRSSPGTNENATDTEIEVMRSQVVRDAVRAKLGRKPKVTIEARGTTDVLDIHARSTNAATAQTEATTFAEVYVELRRSQQVGDLSKTAELIQGQLADLDKQLAELERPLRELDARLATTTDPKVKSQLQVERQAKFDSIAIERRTLEGRRSSFEDQLNRQLLTGIGNSGGVQLVSKAELPRSPHSPGPLRNGALGLAGGLMLGVCLAFLLDQLDDRIRRKEELEAALGIPVLGLLPRQGRRALSSGVVSLHRPNSLTAEAYRTLRTSLQFMGIDRPITCLQVTSATKAEGKTTVVSNLAASFAQAGKRVIVLDCDLRRSRVHEAFGLPNDQGFTSVLLHQRPLADAVTTLHDEPFLAVLTAGPIPPNPSELLASARATAIIKTLRANCDILLIDSPPVLPVTDALVVSRHVDATLLVARVKQSTKGQVIRAQELLSQVGAPLVGTVLNGVVHDSGEGYGYGYVSKAPPATKARDQSESDVAAAETGRDNGGPDHRKTSAARQG